MPDPPTPLQYTEYGQALADAGLMPPVPPDVGGIEGLDSSGYPLEDYDSSASKASAWVF